MASLFGNQNAQTGSSLFGASNNANTQSQSLFGQSSTQPSGGLFGSSQQQQQQQQPQPQQQQQQQQQQASNSLFGQSTQPSLGLLGSTQQQPQQQQQQQQQQPSSNPFGQSTNQNGQSLAGGLGGRTTGALSAHAQREAAASRLQSIGLNASVREKSIPDQIQTIYNKWQPDSPDTLLQTHIYNSVSAAFAPFYHPAPGEDERQWEDALARRPKSSAETDWVPVLVRGYKQLGDRVEIQARSVNDMRNRLHEINNCLKAIIHKHQQDLSVRIEAAKRQHAVLSQRTLRLAVKCQVLRNRGYALDATEENLRQTLLNLEKSVLDPSFSSREEEIWARMVTLRERARWLEEEGKRVGAAVEAQRQDGKSQVPANVIESTKRILKDYDGQLQHLSSELDDVRGELTQWEETQRS